MSDRAEERILRNSSGRVKADGPDGLHVFFCGS